MAFKNWTFGKRFLIPYIVTGALALAIAGEIGERKQKGIRNALEQRAQTPITQPAPQTNDPYNILSDLDNYEIVDDQGQRIEQTQEDYSSKN